MKRIAVAVGMMTGLMVLGLPGTRAGAQAGPAPAVPFKTSVLLKRIEAQKLRTPEYRANVNPVAVKTAREWYQITAHYDTHQEWADELNLICYVLLRNKTPGTGPRQILLRGEVSVINIAKGKHKYEWYVHPGTLARYGEPEAVAVLINRQGQLMHTLSLPHDNKRWWEELTPLGGLVLRRSDTPFGLLCYDDFEQVKPAAEGAGR